MISKSFVDLILLLRLILREKKMLANSLTSSSSRINQFSLYSYFQGRKVVNPIQDGLFQGCPRMGGGAFLIAPPPPNPE